MQWWRLSTIRNCHQPIMKLNVRSRHAVIARRISYGTRTCEGSLAYCSLLSVIETCRLRKIDPWSYIAAVLAQARKGILPPAIPAAS